MCVKSILWILLSISIQGVSLQEYNYDYEEEAGYEDAQPLNCSTTESIKGGSVTYSQGGLEGSVLTYHCDLGTYPSPVSYRVCGADGEWSPMRLSSGRPTSTATCKDVLCPAQLQLDNGVIWPRNQWFRVGMTQSFSCQDGFTLSGSEQRNCTLSGEWTGAAPICDDHADDCDDPGIPPGGQRSVGQFLRGEKVTYWCQAGLHLLGSAERVCLENREWSGSAPRCQGPNTFDSPSSVAAALAGSLAGLMDVFSPDAKKKREGPSFGRAFRVGEVSRMNVYILLDTSGSIKKEDFEVSRNATIALIRKLDSYDVQLNFHVVSFATEVKVIVEIRDTHISGDADEVIETLLEFDYHSHGRKTGTNLHSALHQVSERINFFKQNSAKNHFNETQHIIIIETDGYSNTGAKPQSALAQIRNILEYDNKPFDHTKEKMLDVYVFGVGEIVKKEELNSLASQKTSEQHVFILKDFRTLGEVFNSIISDSTVTMCGIAQEDISKKHEDDPEKAFTTPWHVTLKSPEWGIKKHCSGTIVSQNWVLTAAHCFAKESTGRVATQLSVTYGEGQVKVNKVIMHPNYNVSALRQRNVSEFYDYDVALVQTNSSIPLSWKARPICLPCTIPASRAMRKINSTCGEHRKELLPHKVTPAFFIHKTINRDSTHIHTQTQRPACVEKARQTLTEPTDVTLDEYVPDRFLCTGGTEGYHDGITCKGDSGGSLFLQKRKRFFQVGVVSWGTLDVCNKLYSAVEKHAKARDFHIDLFGIMPWLKEHLGEEITFLPEIK
ncbi:complement C2 [Leuresthes tenuis]|uniref:complement C2 n=1 Tax=Leuresthes tenuis TaxID=355514 RepID=UPI003B5114B2